MAVSYGQRGILGQRYGSGAYGNERQRLLGEYQNAPNRNAAGMQASQFAQSLAQNQANYETSLGQQQQAYAQNQANWQKQYDMQAAGMSGPDYSKYPGPGGYLARYPDVANSLYYSKDPYAHYLNEGKAAGYQWVGDPTPDWSEADKASFYYYMYPDVKNSGMEARKHYDLFGYKEGRFWPQRSTGNNLLQPGPTA